MDAKEAMSITLDAQNMEGIYKQIREEAESGFSSATIYNMTEEQADKLREQGYSVSWNGATLWWEVSW